MNNGGSPLNQYRVERKCITTKKDWETIIETTANTYTHTDTKNIVYKHKYQYRVFCSNKAGESPPGGPTPIVAARKRKCKLIFFWFFTFISKNYISKLCESSLGVKNLKQNYCTSVPAPIKRRCSIKILGFQGGGLFKFCSF